MDLSYPPEAETFRKEIRGWLEENLPRGWFDEGFEMSPSERRDFNESWVRRLHEGGWICASWPKDYGGKGLSIMENVVLNEEFARAGAPMRADFFGDTLVGPTILQWGTEEQKKEFLPKILAGDIRWCQGFSEPNSGSDLASLKTTAVLDGDEWVINGQKVWTTQAQHADYVFLLCRTDPNVAQHAGISYLLVPMKQPGVDVRPIVQPDGTAEFNETFFTNARCPKQNVVGGVNNGWKVAMTTLGFERGSSATTSHRRFQAEVDAIVAHGRHQREQRPWCRRDRCDQQDVLERTPSRHDGVGDRHLGARLSDPDRPRRRRVVAGRSADGGPARLPGEPASTGVLLQPLRDDLGRHGRDPAQHRG